MTDPRIRYYQVRRPRYDWARFFLTSDGLLSIASDYGHFGHWWTHPGCEIRKFLIGCDTDYVTRKFVAGDREYDAEETLKAIKRRICELRHAKRIKQAAAREEWELLGYHQDLCDEYQLHLWHDATKLTGYDADIHELIVRGYPRQAMSFMEHLWPLFVEALKKELADEAQAPGAELFVEVLKKELADDENRLGNVRHPGTVSADARCDEHALGVRCTLLHGHSGPHKWSDEAQAPGAVDAK